MSGKTDAEFTADVRDAILALRSAIQAARDAGVSLFVVPDDLREFLTRRVEYDGNMIKTGDKDEVVHYLKGESGARPSDIILVNRTY